MHVISEDVTYPEFLLLGKMGITADMKLTYEFVVDYPTQFKV